MKKPLAEHGYMLSDLTNGSPKNSAVVQPSPSREWVPTWLRKTRTLPLAAVCVIFAAALEALDFEVRRHRGLVADSKHSSSITTAKYLPTVGIVAIGFACKAIASDAKKVTPWSSMTRKWSKSSHSVTLDYINSLEVFSIISAARRRHWAVLTGLIVGFVCGALVAVANSLIFVDLSALSSEHATFNKATTLDFNGTLETTSNQTLAISYNYQDQQPYAAVAAETLPNGQSGPWTKDSYVFESFTNTSQLPKNATIESSMKAFYPGWTCHPISFFDISNKSTSYEIIFRANTSKQSELNCSRDVEISWAPGFQVNQKSLGWLNLTACDEAGDDLRLVSIVGQRTNITKPTDSEKIYNTSLASVICSPSFTLQDAVVRANQSTGEIVQYSLGSSATTVVDIKTSMSAIYVYLNNPVDGRSQQVIATNEIGFTSSNAVPIANISGVAAAAALYIKSYYFDPFTSSLLDNEAALVIDSYLESPEKLKSAVESQANSIVAQVVNILARKNMTGTVNGELWISGPKMFLRQTSLRALQAFLLLIAIACVLQSTLIRPKTVLREDPGSVAAQAIILASSDKRIETTFAREAVSSDMHMQKSLKSEMWRLQPSGNGALMLEAANQDQHGPLSHGTQGTQNHEGFRPIALRAWAKWSVIATLLVVMMVLAALMALSRAHNGICRNTPAASDAFAFVPTVILLLLGYACSGIDASVRTMARYKSLWKGSSKKQPLLFNFRDAPSVWAPLRALKNGLGLTVAASSFAILVIPAVKIVAAGLYTVTLVQTSHSIQPLVDRSLVDYVQDTFSLPVDTSAESYSYRTAEQSTITMDLEGSVQSASQFTEWTMNPDFGIPIRAGILENLVFSNLTSVGEYNAGDADLSSSEITVNVPAIAVDVTCKSSGPMGIVVNYANCSGGEPYFAFYGFCETAACNSTMNVTSDSDTGSFFLSEYSQAPCQKATANRFQGSTFVRYDMGYQVLLGDFAPIQTYVTNNTFINATENVPITPGMLNITSFPTIFAAVCSRNLTRVTVDTTFGHKTSATNTTLNTWNPIRFNASTLKYDAAPIANTPYWLAPPAKTKAWDHFNQYDTASDTPGLLDSPSLWPTRRSSTSFFELLASHATYQLGNLSVLLEPDGFAAAAAAVYTSYTTNMLTQLRSWALNESANAAPRPVQGGVLAAPQARIVQSLPSTVALEACLAVILLCLVWVALRFPSEAVLPKNPGSIAATASLVAGSALVERLRGGGQGSVDEAAGVWQEGRAALGWWAVGKEDSLEEYGRDDQGGGDGLGDVEWLKMRWGIDVGEGVLRGSWKEQQGRIEVD